MAKRVISLFALGASITNVLADTCPDYTEFFNTMQCVECTLMTPVEEAGINADAAYYGDRTITESVCQEIAQHNDKTFGIADLLPGPYGCIFDADSNEYLYNTDSNNIGVTCASNDFPTLNCVHKNQGFAFYGNDKTQAHECDCKSYASINNLAFELVSQDERDNKPPYCSYDFQSSKVLYNPNHLSAVDCAGTCILVTDFNSEGSGGGSLRSLGEDCEDSGQCASNFCPPETHKCTESPGAPLNSECTDNNDCESGLCDSATDTCKMSNTGTCANNDDCATGNCDSGSCALQVDGGSCNAPEDCQSNQCISYFCQALSGVQEYCFDNSNCQSGLVCQDSKCKAQTGGSCAHPNDCATGNCESGECAAAVTTEAPTEVTTEAPNEAPTPAPSESKNAASIADEANVHTKTDPGKMDVDKWNILCEAGKFLNNNGTALSCQTCDETTFKDSYTSVNIDGVEDHLKHHKCCLFPSQVVCVEMMKRYKEACSSDCGSGGGGSGGQCVPNAEWLGSQQIKDAMDDTNCFLIDNENDCKTQRHEIGVDQNGVPQYAIGNDQLEYYCWWSTASPEQPNNNCEATPSTPTYCNAASTRHLESLISNFDSNSITDLDNFCGSLDPDTCNDYSAQGGGYGTSSADGNTRASCCQVVA